jgi:hypothetical protein
MLLIFFSFASSSRTFVVNVLLRGKFKCLQLLLDSGPRVFDALLFSLAMAMKPKACTDQAVNPWIVL